MQSMKLNEVQINNIPTEMTEEVISELNIIVSYAKLYNLSEFDYEKRFVTKSTVIEGDCPHCEGSQEIGIDMISLGEVALVPCVCNEEHIGYNLTDTITSVQPIAPTIEEDGEFETLITTTVEMLQPNAVEIPETIGDTLVTQASNQVAIMKLMGYDLTDVAQGLPTTAYQLLVIGQHDAQEVLDAVTTNPSFAGQNLKVIPMAVGVTPTMAESEIETPRIRSMEERVWLRNKRDLTLLRDVEGVVAQIESNMSDTELDSNTILDNMGNYDLDVNVFKSFIRTMVSFAKVKNARYDVINPNNHSRIASAYYLHTPTGQHYMCTMDFEPQAQVPSNYMISRVPQPSERTINTADLVRGIETNLADITSGLETMYSREQATGTQNS